MKTKAPPGTPFDPLAIYKQAEVFHRSAVTLWQAEPTEFMAAWAVCGAFALELYFKCLIARDGRRAKGGKGGHELVELFGELAEADQVGIKERFAFETRVARAIVGAQVQQFRRPRKDLKFLDFDFCLAASNDAFKVIRYNYENHPPPREGQGWLGPHLNLAARAWIVELHPDWKDVDVSMIPRPNPPQL